MSHARMKILLFSIISPDVLIHAAVGKPGFRRISGFLFSFETQSIAPCDRDVRCRLCFKS